MGSQIRQWIYGLLAIAGFAATWYFNLQFMDERGGFVVSTFIADVYANAASSSIGNDLAVGVFAFLVWLFAEARRLEIRHAWIFAVLTFGIAFAFSFPLFLFVRERRLASLAEG